MATALQLELFSLILKKAFDIIDHRVLVEELCGLNLAARIINWIIDFLSNRSQRIKLSEGCYSEWGLVPSGVPQGTKLGLWLFIVLINELDVDNLANLWKYVDDTTTSEVVAKGNRSCAQEIAHRVVEWSTQNRVQLNSDKCKELRISFVKDEPRFAPLVDGNELERASSAKLLGLTISSNLTWNEHISDVIEKASKCLYFSVQLERSRVPWQDMSSFYTACVRSVLTYAAPVLFYALLKYLKDELVRVEKRAMSIICPGMPYQEVIEPVNIVPIVDFITGLGSNTFNTIIKVPEHHLNSLIPFSEPSRYVLRCNKRFIVPKCKTNRFRNSFIIRFCIDNIYIYVNF